MGCRSLRSLLRPEVADSWCVIIASLKDRPKASYSPVLESPASCPSSPSPLRSSRWNLRIAELFLFYQAQPLYLGFLLKDNALNDLSELSAPRSPGRSEPSPRPTGGEEPWSIQRSSEYSPFSISVSEPMSPWAMLCVSSSNSLLPCSPPFEPAPEQEASIK